MVGPFVRYLDDVLAEVRLDRRDALALQALVQVHFLVVMDFDFTTGGALPLARSSRKAATSAESRAQILAAAGHHWDSNCSGSNPDLDGGRLTRLAWVRSS